MKQDTAQKPTLYIDIDGVLLANEFNLAFGAREFIKYAAENHETFWLTAHCMYGDPEWAVQYVNRASKDDLLSWLATFKATRWNNRKTEAIDMSRPFLWFDDNLFPGEKRDLEKSGVLDSWVEVDLAKNPEQLYAELNKLKANRNDVKEATDNKP